MISVLQARALLREPWGAALTGSGVGLALGAVYILVGLGQAISDHDRAARIATATGGGFSETMLQREAARLDPAALHLARTHDALGAEAAGDSGQAWPSRPGERLPAGRRGSALEGARQLDCLTEAVYFEARGETSRGQAAVAQVVMNRVADPSFPKTVCGVVFQGAAAHGCQFSFACDGSMRNGLEAEAWDRARRVAERALSGVALADIGKATHFHTLAVQPDWGPQMLRVAQVGLHVFYRFNPHAPIDPAVDRAVMTGLPTAPATALRVTAAAIDRTLDATPAAPAAEAKSATAKAADAAAVVKASEAADSDR